MNPGGIIVKEDPKELARVAAEKIINTALRAVRLRGTFTMALSGGNTPILTYEALASREYEGDMPWDKTQIYWCDERCVSPDHPDSNYGLVHRHMLSKLDLHSEQIHRIIGEDPDYEHAAAVYGRLIPPVMDLLVLGMGEDGHTASLFPGSPALAEPKHKVVQVVSPKPPPHRITISPIAINNARHLMVLVTGKQKAPVVMRALVGEWDPDKTPAQLARRGLWFLDREAAAGV